MQTSFRTPDPLAHRPTVTAATTSARRWWWPTLAAAAGLVLLTVGGSWWFLIRSQEELIPVGRYQVALDRTWLAYATSPTNRPYLGDPVWKGRFEGRACVAFEFYLACHDERAVVRGTLDEFDLVDLGRRTLPGG